MQDLSIILAVIALFVLGIIIFVSIIRAVLRIDRFVHLQQQQLNRLTAIEDLLRNRPLF